MDLEKLQAFKDSQAQHADTLKQDNNHNELVGSLHNLLMATMVSKDPKMVEVAQNLSELLNKIGEASASFGNSSLHLLPLSNQQLAAAVQTLADKLEGSTDKEELAPYFADLSTQISRLAKPIINIPTSPATDLKPLLAAIQSLEKTVRDSEVPENDDTNVVAGLQALKTSLDNLVFPIPNYVLPFKDGSGKAVQQQVTLPSERLFERVTNTDGASTAFTTFVAATGLKNYIRGYSIANTSASNGYVDFRDGSAGAVLWSVPIPANGGANVMLNEPIFWGSAGTALAYDVSASLTTVVISITGYQST